MAAPHERRWRRLACLVLLASACGDEARSTAPAPGQVASALGAPAAPPASAHAATDPAALAEIVARLPSATPPGPSATVLAAAGASGSATPIEPPPPALAGVDVRPPTRVASAATERALRASLYHDLVDRCRTASGGLLPPDAVTISMRIGPDGRIDRSEVSANAKDPANAEAARCMLRILRTTDVRLPGAVGEVTLVHATVPSVD